MCKHAKTFYRNRAKHALDTLMSEASASNTGSAPEVAYFPPEQRWYGGIQNVAGGDPAGVRVVRATTTNDLFSPWETVCPVEASVFNEGIALLPGLARNQNSSLLVDSEGWAYLFFATGAPRPDVETWRIDQLRFRVSAPAVVFDTFSAMSPDREDGDPLAGTVSEIGSRPWQTNTPRSKLWTGFLTSDATLTNGSVNAGLDFDPEGDRREVNDQYYYSIAADLDPTGSGWVGIGFSETQTGNLWLDGQYWILIKEDPPNVEVWEGDTTNGNVLFVGPAPGFVAGYNHLVLDYSPVDGVVRARVNGTGLDLAPPDPGFTPSIHAVVAQMVNPTTESTRIDNFEVRWRPGFYSADFESGDTSGWSAVCPPTCEE